MSEELNIPLDESSGQKPKLSEQELKEIKLQLEIQGQELQNQKTSAEIKQIKRPALLKASVLIPLIGFFSTVLYLVLSGTIDAQRTENNKIKAILEYDNIELEAKKDTLEKENQLLREGAKSLQIAIVKLERDEKILAAENELVKANQEYLLAKQDYLIKQEELLEFRIDSLNKAKRKIDRTIKDLTDRIILKDQVLPVNEKVITNKIELVGFNGALGYTFHLDSLIKRNSGYTFTFRTDSSETRLNILAEFLNNDGSASTQVSYRRECTYSDRFGYICHITFDDIYPYIQDSFYQFKGGKAEIKLQVFNNTTSNWISESFYSFDIVKKGT